MRPSLLGKDTSAADPFEEAHRRSVVKRKHRPKLRRTVGLPLERREQYRAIGRIISRGPGKPRRMHPGPAIQRIHLQARVVCQHGRIDGLKPFDSFLAGVAFQCGRILNYGRRPVQIVRCA